MSEMQRLEAIPPNMRMNYGPVLKKDNPLVSSWVQAVNELPKEKTAKTDRMQALVSIIALLNTLVAKFFDKEEDDEDDVTQEDNVSNQPATKA